MGWRKTLEMDPKAQLVREIFSLSSAFASCNHRRRSPRTTPTFVDWYLILRIDENAGVDLVRKRYHYLALHLHPDKNNHPQAEVAFKLVSEAYACLSDEARRRAFDCDRRESACQVCSRKLHHVERESPRNMVYADGEEGLGAAEKRIRSQRHLRALEEMRSRIREDAKVIDNCMRLRARQASSRRESPIFDPSDCLLYPDYPHPHGLRVPKEACRYPNTARAPSYDNNRRGGCESPVYEIRSGAASRCSNFGFSP